jgi:hypothetical protein
LLILMSAVFDFNQCYSFWTLSNTATRLISVTMIEINDIVIS